MPEEEIAVHRAARMAGCAVFGKWLLIFLAVAVLLAIPLIPSHCSWGPDQARLDMVKSQSQIHHLALGLKYFHTEYNKLPLQSDSGGDLSTTTSAGLLLPLLAQDPTTNPRNIKFVDFPIARDGRFGVASNPPTLVDSWGQPYHVILDSDHNNQITNPEAAADPKWLAKHPQPPFLTAKSAIYSSGPDSDPTTWEDNITSWR